jgi:hypothetical protein
MLMCRDVNTFANVTTERWMSMDAIRAFAGDTPEVAVLYPGDDAYGLIPDLIGTHYEVSSLEGTNFA